MYLLMKRLSCRQHHLTCVIQGSNVRGQLGLDDRNFKGNSYESNKDRGTASSPQLVVALQHQYVVWCGAGSAFSACITIEPVH